MKCPFCNSQVTLMIEAADGYIWTCDSDDCERVFETNFEMTQYAEWIEPSLFRRFLTWLGAKIR